MESSGTLTSNSKEGENETGTFSFGLGGPPRGYFFRDRVFRWGSYGQVAGTASAGHFGGDGNFRFSVTDGNTGAANGNSAASRYAATDANTLGD